MATNPGDALDAALRRYYMDTFAKERVDAFLDHAIRSGTMWGVKLGLVRRLLLAARIYHDTTPEEAERLIRQIEQRQ